MGNGPGDTAYVHLYSKNSGILLGFRGCSGYGCKVYEANDSSSKVFKASQADYLSCYFILHSKLKLSSVSCSLCNFSERNNLAG